MSCMQFNIYLINYIRKIKQGVGKEAEKTAEHIRNLETLFPELKELYI